MFHASGRCLRGCGCTTKSILHFNKNSTSCRLGDNVWLLMNGWDVFVIFSLEGSSLFNFMLLAQWSIYISLPEGIITILCCVQFIRWGGRKLGGIGHNDVISSCALLRLHAFIYPVADFIRRTCLIRERIKRPRSLFNQCISWRWWSCMLAFIGAVSIGKSSTPI